MGLGLSARLEKVEGRIRIESALVEKCEMLESRVSLLERFMVLFDYQKLDRLVETIGTVDMVKGTVETLQATIDGLTATDVQRDELRPKAPIVSDAQNYPIIELPIIHLI